MTSQTKTIAGGVACVLAAAFLASRAAADDCPNYLTPNQSTPCNGLQEQTNTCTTLQDCTFIRIVVNYPQRCDYLDGSGHCVVYLINDWCHSDWQCEEVGVINKRCVRDINGLVKHNAQIAFAAAAQCNT